MLEGLPNLAQHLDYLNWGMRRGDSLLLGNASRHKGLPEVLQIPVSCVRDESFAFTVEMEGVDPGAVQKYPHVIQNHSMQAGQ